MEKQSPSHNKHNGHGSISSYIVGFILSLALTAIPYFLVVEKMLTGTTLLLTILGIAVLQMAVQLLFFLHLGRGPKPLYNVVFFFATAGVIVLTVGASLFIMDNLYRNMSPRELVVKLSQEEGIAQINGQETGACSELKENHQVRLSNGQVSPTHVQAKLCDTLTFINEDEADDILGFGSHHNPSSYGGNYDVSARAGRPESITLNQTGDFTFYSNLNPSMTGYFSVELQAQN